jgi:pimeloyl-ACP methyl ester carboxylesterase
MRIFHWLFLTLLFAVSSVSADIVVLIHGFNSTGQDWHNSGIINRLSQQGWREGGHYSYHPQHIIGPQARTEGANLIYTIDLPNTAPMMLQVAYLHAVLQSIEVIAPDETLNLVGHSAGGVVARTVMVMHPEHSIARLITIASPHLGSGAASAGALVASSPLGWMADILGQDELAHSGHLLSELSPQKPGSFLFWLNQQPHPPALHYISLLRVDGDHVISAHSQDLRNVAALGVRAVSYPTRGRHALLAQDGELLGPLLVQP